MPVALPARPLTDAERAALNRAGRGLQVAGTTFGLVGLALSTWRLLSPALPALLYYAVIVYPAVLAIALGYRARLIRSGAACALAIGEAREIRGAAFFDRRRGFGVRALDITVSGKLARFGRGLSAGSGVTLLVAGIEGPPGRGANGSVLALNGSPLPRPYPCRLSRASAASPAAAMGALALGRQP